MAAAEATSRAPAKPKSGAAWCGCSTRTGQHLYYAHLDRQLVQPGQHVRPGDTLGLVGNTGNARTTVPHLHFGIYQSGRGAVDPWPYLHRADPVPAALPTAAGEYLGRWVRPRSAKPASQLKLTGTRAELSPAVRPCACWASSARGCA